MRLAVSECELEVAGEPGNGALALIYFHGQASSCHDDASGYDLPGGFGWIDTNPRSRPSIDYRANCYFNISNNDRLKVDPGSSPPNDCSPDSLANELLGPKDGPGERRNAINVFPLIADPYGQQGANAVYTVINLICFDTVGYNFGGQYQEFETPLTALPCHGNERCISGYFVPCEEFLDGPP